MKVENLTFRPTNDNIISYKTSKLVNRNVFYETFYPMVYCAKLFGLFPNSNIGGNKNSGEDLRQDKYNVSVVATVITTVMILADIYTSITDITVYALRGLDQAARAMFEGFTRIMGLATIFYLFFRGKTYVGYITKWNITNPIVMPHSKPLKRDFNLCLATYISLAICCLILTAWSMWRRWLTDPSDYNITFFTIKLVAYTISLFNSLFVTISNVYYSRALVYGFRTLADNLGQLLRDRPNNMQIQLEKIRQKYQEMCDLTCDTSSINSPLLTIIVAGFSVSLCVLFYLFGTEVKKLTDIPGLVRLVGSILYRAIPITLICVVGQQVMDESTSGLNHIYNGAMNYLTPDVKFQLKLLESKMIATPARLTASDLVYINYDLLTQIAGVVITYALVMIQFQSR